MIINIQYILNGKGLIHNELFFEVIKNSFKLQKCWRDEKEYVIQAKIRSEQKN
jgi:hypothetical protein